MSLNETSLDFGKIFSALSFEEILNNCIPPIFIIGIKVIAISIIPMPPSHWSIARHKSIPLGALSRSVIIVDPVVVIPDILSKKASVKFKLSSEKINGKEPKIAIDNHVSAVKINAWGRSIFLLWSKLDKKNNTPKIIVIIDADTNPESNSL